MITVDTPLFQHRLTISLNWPLSVFSVSFNHGEETTKTEPLAMLRKSCVGLSGHVRRRLSWIGDKQGRKSAKVYVFHSFSKFVFIVYPAENHSDLEVGSKVFFLY